MGPGPLKRFFVLLALGASSLLRADSAGVGTSSASFLELGTGARAAALGQAYVGLASGASGMAYNPAGLAQGLAGDIEISHTQLFQGLLYENLEASLPLDASSSLGFGIQYLDVPSLQGTAQIDDQSNPDLDYVNTASFSPYDLALRFALAKRFSPELLLGVSLQGIEESIDGSNLLGLGFDLGLLYLSPLPQLQFGFAVQNLGIPISDGAESFDQPLNLRIGASYGAWIENTRLLAELDVPEDAPTLLALGAEYQLGSSLNLRAGYRYDSLFDPWSLGLGVQWAPCTIDFSVVPYGELGTSYRASLSYFFGGPSVALGSRTPILSSLSSSAGLVFEPRLGAGSYARSWSLTIDDDRSPRQKLRELLGQGAPPGQIIWDGRSDSGLALAEGKYWASLEVLFSNGQKLSSSPLAIQVTNLAPRPGLRLDPLSSDPQHPDLAYMPLQVVTSLEGPAALRWRLEILDQDGKLFRSYSGEGSPPERGLVWDGKSDSGEDFVSDRVYQAQLQVQDSLGREGSSPLLRFRAVFR